jgi:putative transcriptional regulator
VIGSRRFVAAGLFALLVSLVGTPRAEPALRAREVSLAPGVLLVATPRLVDPNFGETVVLLLGYGPRGALGLVINRRSRVELRALLPELQVPDHAPPVYAGGPVALSSLQFLLESGQPPEGAVPILEGIHTTSKAEAVFALLRAEDSRVRAHAYVGHAGWAPGQLDAEVERRDWYVIAGEAQAVFTSDPGSLWQSLSGQLGGLQAGLNAR